VETAVVLSLLSTLTLGLIVGGLGVYRYSQVAALAREGARYAAVRGPLYAFEHPGASAVTANSIYTNAINPTAIGLPSSQLNYTVQVGSQSGSFTDWDTTMAADPEYNPNTKTVSVKVTYNWVPEVPYFPGVTLASTSTMPISY
jgi:Flp pilus assembly protein TadG